ncbi:MAG: phenylalanine--tRNA ligase subunit beta [Betaproteobacteria bacterium]|nr:phenylalanine--tRNA ligase subunit beta [Betaproteobacteria bacterium]
MKLSENWLRTLINPPLSTRELADMLTMGGVEVELIEPAAAAFDKVVVGEVLKVERHPDADRLTVCQVSTGGEPLTIVCGAPNVTPGTKVPTALAGARLPGAAIKVASVRGVESHGMLCSAKDLGLAETAEGLLVLHGDARVGSDVRQVLELDDQLLTLKPTPNRGDCLSLVGVAREVAAVTGAALALPRIEPVPATIADRLAFELVAPDACPRYCGRIVRGVNPSAPTPERITRRLARSGIRPISVLVDITNYVMLELGQPLHAFDAGSLEGGIRVRYAAPGERLTLLNGETPALDQRFLVIADERKAVALAGVMGGLDTAVGDATRDVFLESAFFAPEVIAGKPRLLGFGSESAHRFERGVDFAGTAAALERATRLVLEICGGTAGPVAEARAALPAREPVRLRLARAESLLGIRIEPARAAEILRRLRFEFREGDGGFQVTPPSYRFDIAIEEDLVEEIARIHGYDKIPAAMPAAPAEMLPAPETRRDAASIRRLLAARDYQEIVSYSFVDSEWERDLAGNAAPIALANPIVSQMSVMRSSLAGGLIHCLAYNVSRKQTRVRLFEIGRCFLQGQGAEYAQPVRVGGIAYGGALHEQWGSAGRNVDFHDVKGDVEALLAPLAAQFEPHPHPALHPGKCARLLCDNMPVGWIGELHPRWQRKYDLPFAPVLFELESDFVSGRRVPAYTEISKIQPIRRDLAVILDANVSYQGAIDVLRRNKPAIVSEIGLFDVYRGVSVGKGKKSLAFSVLFQDTRKTLTDAEVEAAVARLMQVLEQEFGAKLR